MAGLKTFWITISALFLLGACVPQTKQTECGANEAFNASLRTCVPIVGGPSSFINIASFAPVSSITKHNNDFSTMTFEITVSNPYNQSYSITWERIYNANTNTMCSNSLTCSFPASLLSTELGTHVLVAKIKDGNGTTVDSHNFEIRIVDELKPVISTATLNPTLSSPGPYTPNDPRVQFSFTVSNNGATFSGLNNYRIVWTVERAGSTVYTESDTFTNFSPTGSNIAYLGNSPTPYFNPVTQGVGSYVVRAKVQNDVPGEVVAEKMWSFTIAHPSLSPVISRNLYETSGSPAFNTTVNAYNGVAYTSSTAYNFIPAGSAAQANFCVEVQNGEGVYNGDGDYVRVDYYLDGVTLIYSNSTTAVDKQVCLSDAALAVLSTVVFNNTTSTTNQPHTLIARVVDEYLGTEYTSGDMFPSLGTYPITWNLDVKPQNAAPTVAFGTTSTITCTTTTSSTKSGCAVGSDTNFAVGINFNSDDFYTIAANEANLDYSFRLYRNGTMIQECNKADPGADGSNDVAGAEYTCVFSVPSYDVNGPIDVTTQTYQIRAEIIDDGSPISPGSSATSRTLYWNLNATETNTAPSIANWSVAGAVTEGSAITFSADITDTERDNHTYTISYCNDGACTTSTSLTTGTITRTSSANPHNLSVNYILPEDFLLNLTGLGCDAVTRGNTCNVDFFITVTDVPHTAAPLSASSGTGTSAITNFNPAPTLNTAFSNPAPSTFSAAMTFAFVGHPISISNNPSSILNDTSNVAAEKAFRYQWFVKNNTSVVAWTEIEGATSNNLIWTPSLMANSNDNPLSLLLCVEDHPASAVSSPNIIDSTCNIGTEWILTVNNNVTVAQDLSTAPSSTELATASGEAGVETAIWYEEPLGATPPAAYVAMIGNDNRIHVKKVLTVDRGGIDTLDASLMVSFEAVPTGTTSAVKDLSITGDADELYIAYLASRTGSPGSFYPQVRRIDLTQTAGKTAPNTHFGKFGFDYDGLGFINTCTPAADCTATTASGVSAITFAPSGASITGTITLETPNGNFTVDFGVYDGIDTICTSCSGITMANQLATIINTSTNPILAGYSASNSGTATVTFEGARSGDYFDASTDDPRVADRLGKIYIHAGTWYLPFINSTLGGGYNDKLSVYTDTTGAIMSDASILEPSGTAGLATMDAAVHFDNYYTGADLWIALVSKTGSAGKLYRVDPDTYNITENDNIFSGEALLSVQVAASSSNVFTAVRASLASELKLGVYDINGTALDEFEMDDLTNVDPTSSTEDYFNTADITSYRILPYGTEARLFGISKGTTVSNHKLYMARLRDVSGTWTLSCGDCQPVSESDQDLSSLVSLGVAPIRDNPNAFYRLASDGFVTNQGNKDVAFVSFGQLDTSVSAATCDPTIGIFNVEGEAIGSTTIFSATLDAGLYRSPFIKN